MQKFAKAALAYIRKQDLIRPGDRVGVAVSGGLDSVALLRILLELQPELGTVLSVVHLNHKLRREESDGDEQFVRDLASAYDLQFISESCDVKAYTAEKKLGLEAAAREVRYKFFEKLLTENDLSKIATAHTIDDQAETVLLKLARGAGTRGMAGIYPELQVSSTQYSAFGVPPRKAIIRPLLGARRAELQQYLAEIGQSWREDSSNRDVRHTRNRIRHEVLPALEKHVNPRVREAMAEAAEIARADEEFWANELARWMPQVFLQTEACLNRKRMLEAPRALQRRIVRAAAECLGINLEFRHVQEILELNKEHTRAMLPGNWSAAWHKDDIWFERGRKEGSDYEYALPVPGEVEVPEAQIAILARYVTLPRTGQDGTMLRPTQVALVVRNWRAGDRFWPRGRKEPKKVKELLQGRQITGQEKKAWPVIVAGDEVVWVRGFGVRRDWLAKNGQGVLISESQLDPGDRQ